MKLFRLLQKSLSENFSAATDSRFSNLVSGRLIAMSSVEPSRFFLGIILHVLLQNKTVKVRAIFQDNIIREFSFCTWSKQSNCEKNSNNVFVSDWCEKITVVTH